jgi:hypothetical protein
MIRLSISKWQRSTLAVVTARLTISSVWGSVGFSACADVAAQRLIASAARVVFFTDWFPCPVTSLKVFADAALAVLSFNALSCASARSWKVGLFRTWGRASTQTRLDELFARPHTLRTGVDRAHQ